MSKENKFDGEKYTGIDDEPKQWKEASETDMKIFRVAGYNAEKVEAIRELISQ